MISLRRTVFIFCCIAFEVPLLLQTANALPPRRTDTDRISRALLLSADRWPWEMATLLVGQLPRRFVRPLSGQTAKTIGHFIRRRELPYRMPDHNRMWLCAASFGSGGTYLALVADDASGYQPLWDTLISPSVISHTIELVDLNADSVPEIIYHGKVTDADLREWAILGWDDGALSLLAPRMDIPSQDVRDHRLIGDSLQVLDTRDDGARRLRLWRRSKATDWVILRNQSRMDYREFLFRDSIGGYLPEE